MPTKYLRIGDAAIHYRHAGPTTLPGVPPAMARGTVLMIHGEGGSGALFAALLERFADGPCPIAIDLPAHGRSTGLEGPASVADAVGVLRSILDGLGAPPATIVGHGFGGHLALALAAAARDRVRAVATIGTAARGVWAEDAIDGLRDVVRGRAGQSFDTPFFGAAPDMKVIRAFWGEMVKTDPRVRLGDMVAYRDSDLATKLPKIEVPVLVLRGDADRICTQAAADELVGALPAGRLETIPGAGHVAHLEKPDEVSAAIGAWLEQGHA